MLRKLHGQIRWGRFRSMELQKMCLKKQQSHAYLWDCLAVQAASRKNMRVYSASLSVAGSKAIFRSERKALIQESR